MIVTMAATPRREADLFAPLKTHLEGQGYSVHAEVRDCDLVARRRVDPAADDPDADAELIVVELKRGLTLDLLVQAVRRKELTESVYVAVPLEGSRARVRNLRGVRPLLRRLEVGLLAVRFLRSGARVEVIEHPRVFAPRRRRRRRIGVLREIDGRYAEFDSAGQQSRTERITAYKQQCILVAHLLHTHGELSPAEARRLGAPGHAGRLLSANVYGWFERVRRGVYRLHPAGEHALSRYEAELARILDGAGRRA